MVRINEIWLHGHFYIFFYQTKIQECKSLRNIVNNQVMHVEKIFEK